MLIFEWAGLKTSLVFIRTRISHVLIAICLGKEDPQADAACRFSIGRIKALGSRNGNSQIDNVLEWRIRFLRVDGRRLHDIEKLSVFIEQRLEAGVKIPWRDSQPV